MSFGTAFVQGIEMNLAKIRLHFLKYSIRETASEPSLKMQMNICEVKKLEIRMVHQNQFQEAIFL